MLETPARALLIGLALAALVLVAALVGLRVDAVGFTGVLIRALHVVAAMIWVGLVFFVNFVQLAALAAADEPGRAALLRLVVPKVAALFRHASTWTVLSGALLLVTSGYVLPSLVYGSAVGFAPGKTALLWLAAAGGLAMWAFVHLAIWPSLEIVLGSKPGDAAAKAAARERVARFARANLVLALPVTVAMIAAAHLA